jgi:glycosyltransferase involved in cell wall biosynthesis
MKIAHICPFMGEQLGGSERYVFNLSKKQSMEHDVHVYTTTHHLRRSGTHRLNDITAHRFYSPLNIWNINPLAFMLKSLSNSECDVFHIHSYLYSTSNQAVLAKILKRKKALLQIHGGIGAPPYGTSWFKRTVKQLYDLSLGRFTIESSDIVASVSQRDLRLLSMHFSVPEDSIRYIPNAIDTELFRPANRERDSEARTLLYVGDLERWKGIDTLIEWITKWDGQDGRELKVRFVGQGTYYSRLLDLQERLLKGNDGAKIEVVGQRPHREIPALMQEASALILPTRWEGMPTVVLEAMASGIPVITTRAGDIPSLIEDMKTGLLIDRSFDSFKDSIRTVFENRRKVREIVRNARSVSESRFSFSRVCEIVSALYSEIQ